jgi:hypothetical protein
LCDEGKRLKGRDGRGGREGMEEAEGKWWKRVKGRCLRHNTQPCIKASPSHLPSLTLLVVDRREGSYGRVM